MCASVDARVAAVPDSILHLWHGEISDRNYNRRCKELIEMGFDPAIDIVIDEQGCWAWNSDRSDLQAWAERYFASRREDGLTPTANKVALPVIRIHSSHNVRC